MSGPTTERMCDIALNQEHNSKRVLNELVHVAPGNEEFDTLAKPVAADLRRAAGP